MNNKVTVKIYSQEYVISGNKSEEHILRVASYVDEKMKEIAGALKDNQNNSVPVLAAVNLADEYLTTVERFQYLEENNAKAEENIQHYMKLWEEAKDNHIKYQENLKQLTQAKNDSEKMLNESQQEIYNLKENMKKIQMELEKVSEKDYSELESKYKDLESSFFDIQMENIQLKGELERYKKKME